MNTHDVSRYVVVVRPQVLQDSDGSWRAQYPEADWSVRGDSEQNARAKLRDEFERRVQSGQTDTAPNDDLLRCHLANPIPGVYAIDRETYMEIRERPDFDEAINRLIEALD
ncbi:Uncharacterised protein [Mycobacteroides abscessus subsp. massiliense]|uniref:hypothetical protein n=1 Tax=Mycobacteroides abscessus TaxID=36809 RepID=UPI0009A56A7E|nr:hypothetical protein [Mycobacteroides abscessus]SKT78109.1 Uncharacterised protein [Mycobacteroides abscessus subsp. massiliense]